MLLRDAQEEARILYSALRDSTTEGNGALESHLKEALATAEKLVDAERIRWSTAVEDPSKIIGLFLLVSLGLANEFGIDSVEALRRMLLEKSP